MTQTSSGTIGRTQAGVNLDVYLDALKDPYLRRRAFRSCAHMDKHFKEVKTNPWLGGWYYEKWPQWIRAKFYRRNHEELRNLMIAYTNSLFTYDYSPSTKTQLVTLEEARRKEAAMLQRDTWIGAAIVSGLTSLLIGVLAIAYIECRA